MIFLFINILLVIIAIVWVFFFTHAMLRISDAKERVKWMLLFLLLNFIAIPIYFSQEYIKFYKKGYGGLR
jgi:hypothetical protein